MIAADRRRVTPVLGVLALLLAIVLIALWAGLGTGANWSDQANPPPLPPAHAATPPPGVPPLQDFANVWERPLFSPDRKPIAAPAASGSDTSTGDLELTGVIMLPGLHMALLRERGTGRTLRVLEGQSTGGATVVEVHPRSAVVEINGSRSELPLKIDSGAPTAGDGSGTSPAAPMVQPSQVEENAGAESRVPEQQDNSGSGARRPRKDADAQADAPPPAPPHRQSSAPDKDASNARAQALKARIEQRRKRAAAKQAADKQSDGD